MIFSLTEEQQTKLNEWLKIQYAKLVEKQKGTDAEMWHVTGEDGTVYPYTGAIGGGCTYSFFPTGLGDVVKVSYGDETIDLTDYDTW